jgi:hypothetical protein
MNKKECLNLYTVLNLYAREVEEDMFRESRPHLQEVKGYPKRFKNKNIEEMEKAYDTLRKKCGRLEGIFNPQGGAAYHIKTIRSEFGGMLE